MSPAGSRIAVIGLGSIGGIVAGSLRAAGRHDVVACVRRGVDRLVVDRPDDGIEVAISVLLRQTGRHPTLSVLAEGVAA